MTCGLSRENLTNGNKRNSQFLENLVLKYFTFFLNLNERLFKFNRYLFTTNHFSLSLEVKGISGNENLIHQVVNSISKTYCFQINNYL